MRKTKISFKKILSIILTILIISFVTVIPVNAENKKVIIGGEPFGLKLYCTGVMITKFENINKNKSCPAQESGLEVNDIITKVNGKKVKSNESLCEIIENSKGEALTITVVRNNEIKSFSLIPILNDNGVYKAGMWVKDSCAGMGTITYYDQTNSTYAALGHGICDVDSGGLMLSNNVEILKANITSITKSYNNQIGTLNGYFKNATLGTIGYNTSIGIYGKIDSIPQKKEYLVGNYEEIIEGEAYIYCTINGETPQKYKIEIIEKCNDYSYSNKNFLIKITDENLINKTGGIVQGMSGSPIIQNNKIVGAVTHVLLNNPTVGYGINITNMLNNTNGISPVL